MPIMGMDEDGYLFEFQRVDMKANRGMAKGRMLLIAATRNDAVECAREYMPTANHLLMIDSGAELLAEAKRLGLKMHQAKII